mmetsp:Transcript_35184/g.74315  ORF Transcript_35184/g.74315 Transcript_35184/m.74315 type:complete len:391 (+) Transcript_35184:812-1984(+)
MEMSMPQMVLQPSRNSNNASLPDPSSSSLNNNNTISSNNNNGNTDQQANPETAKIQNVKFINATSFVLTSIMVIGVVLLRVREEGVFGDDFLWMKYQTLVTPPNYVDYLWIPLYLLQGLFIYASTHHKTLQHSPLVGYSQLLSSSPKESIAVHYPAICTSTILMIYSHDYGHIFLAFLCSLLCIAVLANVLRLQTNILQEMGWSDDNAPNDSVNVDESFNTASYTDFKTSALYYTTLILPFELLAGHVLGLGGIYFNMVLHSFESLPSGMYLFVAVSTLVGLTCGGVWLLWKTERKYYGVGGALVWYLLGVSIELHTPSQPIYNEFSDRAILTTQVVALLSTLMLLTMLGVRVMNTFINKNLFNCVDTLGGGGDRSVVSEEDVGTDYVHA